MAAHLNPRSYRLRMLAAAILAASGPSAAALDHLSALAPLSLEQLSEIVVSSVSRRDERLTDAAAAVYVIRAEDIRRSGARTLPEALRLAPNLQVARINAADYAISARGGNSSTANKLLVMIDGRTVYTPLFSGVFWDVQGVLLEDVERIEVISGPGGTIWGSNAVNGVIHVITRSAANSQGRYASTAAGSGERLAGTRYGAPWGTGEGHYRIYGFAREHGASEQADGSGRADAGWLAQAGWRGDWSAGRTELTLQGDVYRGRNERLPTRRVVSGANLRMRVQSALPDDASLVVQAYFDHTTRDIPQLFGERLNTIDIEFQHQLPPTATHALMWGAGARHARDDVSNSESVAFLPAQRTMNHAHLFVQDRWTLDERLVLTAGIKLERNPYTGIESLPSLSLAYKPDEPHLVWAALARAVRAPARIDRDLFLLGLVAGGPNFRSELADVLQLGYRGTYSNGWTYSATLFHHRFDRLRSVEPAAVGDAQLENRIHGTTNGLEVWGNYQSSYAWRLSAGATYLDTRFRRRPGSGDLIGLPALGNDPRLSWQVRAARPFSARGEVELALRHVGRLPDPSVPAYTVADLHLRWQAQRGLGLGLAVENLFNRRHAEWGSDPNRSVFGRQLLLSLEWRE